MKQQVKFTAQLGFSSEELKQSKLTTQGCEEVLAFHVSKVCGGCSTKVLTGWWCEDGASHSDKFDTSKLGQEITIELSVTSELHKEHETQQAIQKACVQLNELGLPINWVHLSRSVFNGLHFSVDALKAENQGEKSQILTETSLQNEILV